MSGTELRLLADHMGHDVNIHINHYAMQANLLERSKVARVLCAINNGHLTKFTHTKELDTVDIQTNWLNDGKGLIY